MNNESTTKAPKDKICAYCRQAFTSSSLGRHLDLYIKEKNPKAPDGIHNVDEIRKLRGSITRRQPRGGGRRDTTASAATGKEGNDGTTALHKGNPQRAANRQTMKSSLEVRQKFQDALDTAKAAELALREMISSWRAAKHQFDFESMPFDFNPLSLDFPGLCLQCLKPPPTLHSSTPYSTLTSWSLDPPGQKQHAALSTYFREEFRQWKASCTAVTMAMAEELTYPPSQATTRQEDARELVQKAEMAAESLEAQVAEHLSTVFYAWEQLPAPRQQELWSLEMARSVGRKQEQLEALKETQHSLRQENTNLKAQIDSLNQQQQPKEFRLVPPMTLRVDPKLVDLWTEGGVGGQRSAMMEDRHADLGTVVSGAIERWKNVVVTSRVTSSMISQRNFDASATTPLQTPTSATYPVTPDVPKATRQQPGFETRQSRYPQSSPNVQSSVARNVSVSSVGPMMGSTSETKPSAASTPSESQMDSDEDADADADEDEDADHPSTLRPNTYPQRASNYADPGVLAAQQQQQQQQQQVHMSQQAFDHQMQNLTHHLNQGGHGGHNMGWDNQ
ncbi:hypothetical protein M406DRAFT_342452 [Cryphonectria parasitica EP155]|uniref:Uncharacterized protein n=1 Tax=Cryphonectria parasitica (strain ATCC 38755 / EP155) TaxID=660469 RepID=A0A9P5CK60_CRYP1|nr:uncharacterized protein M406DRAFT_342452 [Cryphonectria parasitica EP155]KAF3761718.1 hypothetical protein M406DRAFT_342452 [Cryphonectria parasitica EP155]